MPLLPSSRYFPPAEDADPEGIVGFGGNLTTEWLLDAYRHGIFPWPVSEPGYPMVWWSPDPRAIIEFSEFHVPRRLRPIVRSNRFSIAFDRDFAGVIHGCATSQDREHGTWITPEMEAAYTRLHELGHAHSVEAWDGDRLAGGVYGVAIGGLFAAESMFYRVAEASKVALVHLVEHLDRQGYVLLDIQQLTPHTERFGAIEIPRVKYLRRLREALEITPLPFV